jgi:ribosomal protein S18 acetylase RimI-like enzyme
MKIILRGFDMKTIHVSLIGITQDYMSDNLSKLLEIESNWTDIGEQPWNENNFLLDLPYKWELSFAAEDRGEILGYVIGSKIAENTARVNKIVVGREYRKNHIGTSLIRRFETACLERGLYDVDLKAIVGNDAANNFYLRLGYEKQPGLPVEGTDGKMRYVYRKRLK